MTATASERECARLRARVAMLEDAVLAAGDLLENNTQPPGAPSLDYLAEGFWDECDNLRRKERRSQRYEVAAAGVERVLRTAGHGASEGDPSL